MAVTIKDIAADVGASYTTVSRALSDSGSVEESKRERTLEIARSLGEVPNQVAVISKSQYHST